MLVRAGQRLDRREELHQPLVIGPARLGADPQPTGRVRPPILPVKVTPHGAWRYARTSPSDGSCGVHAYPCFHPGVDLAGAAGTKVYAPEDGVVVAVGNGASKPWTGYGPWIVVIKGASGVYHLLAHLSPAQAALALVGARVSSGQLVGVTSSANHVHWEIRLVATSSAWANKVDPFVWLERTRNGVSSSSWVLLAAAAAAYFFLG